MIIKNQIITDIKIDSVKDLYKLRPIMKAGKIKINKSQNLEIIGKVYGYE